MSQNVVCVMNFKNIDLDKTCIVRTIFLVFFFFVVTIINSLYAQSYKEVTMLEGETQTLYLPSSVTSKNLKSVTFYSNGISYVQVVSYTSYSVKIKAIKSFSSPIIVRCDYRYYVQSGSYTYEASGYYDYRVTVLGSGGSTVKPTSIKFASSVKAIEIGESVQLTPIVLPENATYTLSWSINDKSVATISQDGLLFGKSEGAADLKVMTDNGVYAMLRVVVSNPEPISVSLSSSSLTMVEGDVFYLSASVYPSNANQSVTWSSSNTNVVAVGNTGRVTAIKPGTAVVSAKTVNGKTATCTIICKEAIPNITISDVDGIDNLPSVANVVYRRTFFAGWNSVCVPFTISQILLDDFCDNSKLATIKDIEVIGAERFLSVNIVNSVEAGVPCLIYVAQDVECVFNLKNVILKTQPNNSSNVKGSYQREVIGANCYKLSTDGSSFGLTQIDEAVVAPFRLYVKLNENLKQESTIELVRIKFTQIEY